MKRTLALLVSALLVLSSSKASAQLAAAKDGPIVYGHHHLNTTNMDAEKVLRRDPRRETHQDRH